MAMDLDPTCREFAFIVPQCDPGTVLKVPAVDGVMLHVPLPDNVKPGDKLYMAKGDDDKWSISKAVRVKKAEWRSAESLAADLAGQEVVKVRMDTTKGPIFMQVVPAWAPLATARFLDLVEGGFYDDIAIYRAIPGALVQFGVVKSTDPRSKRYSPLPDDPLIGVPFEDGVVSFAAAGSGTRKATVCFFLGDFKSQLGTKQPETPFGKVCPESMATLHGLYTGYGDIPQCGGKGPDPIQLEEQGNEYIRKGFPECDFITGAKRA